MRSKFGHYWFKIGYYDNKTGGRLHGVAGVAEICNAGISKGNLIVS